MESSVAAVHSVTESDLKSLAVYLFNENLIAENDKTIVMPMILQQGDQSIKCVFFCILMKQEKDCLLKIMEITKAFLEKDKHGPGGNLNTTSENKKFNSSETKNPFLIAAVIESICGFLKLRDIKNVRLICKEWDHAAVPFLRKLSRISFGYPLHPTNRSKSVANFKHVFQHSLSQIPFTAAKLTQLKKGNWPDCPWPESALLDLFETVGKDIKDLSIEKMRVENHFTIYDMSGFLKELYITKLNVTCGSGSVKMKFSLDSLTHVKILKLRECNFCLTNENCISPVEVELIYCSFLFPNEDRIINKFINFTNMRRCTIFNCMTRPVNLDLIGNFVIDTIDLTGITVLNWKYSNWKVNVFNISGIRSEFVEETPIDIKTMKVHKCSFVLPAIPKSVEKLTIMNSIQSSNFPTVCLTNLTHLKISPRDVKNFQSCQNLVSLEIFPSVGERSIEIDWIPKSVKRLRIAQTLEIRGEGRLQLEKLIFCEYSLKTLRELLTYLNPEIIVIRLFCYFRCVEKDFKENEEELLLALERGNSLAIGPISWDCPGLFKSDRIVKLVDKRSPYYLFQNNRGVGINRSLFEKMADM